MRYVVCHGKCDKTVRADALRSVKRPYVVVTMQPDWFDTAMKLRLQRYQFSDKLKLMRFVLGKQTLCLHAKDGTEDSMAFGASMYAMNIPIWEVR